MDILPRARVIFIGLAFPRDRRVLELLRVYARLKRRDASSAYFDVVHSVDVLREEAGKGAVSTYRDGSSIAFSVTFRTASSSFFSHASGSAKRLKVRRFHGLVDSGERGTEKFEHSNTRRRFSEGR